MLINYLQDKFLTIFKKDKPCLFYNRTQCVPRSKQSPARLQKNNLSALYNVKVAVCSEIRKEHIHRLSLYGANVLVIVACKFHRAPVRTNSRLHTNFICVKLQYDFPIHASEIGLFLILIRCQPTDISFPAIRISID